MQFTQNIGYIELSTVLYFFHVVILNTLVLAFFYIVLALSIYFSPLNMQTYTVLMIIIVDFMCINIVHFDHFMYYIIHFYAIFEWMMH